MSRNGNASILFVCTGNTCRSPMAEFLFRAMAGPDGPEVGSAGLAAFDGEPANKTMREAVEERYGLDLSGHMARRFTLEMGERADLIVVMTPGHREWIVSQYPELAAKIRILTDFSENGARRTAGIPDPFGGDVDVYGSTAADMEPYLHTLLAYILSTDFETGV